MGETARLGLPLVEGGQAQKHVTVNEAFARLDALGQRALQSATLTRPPGAAAEGQVGAVPAGAVRAWAGQAGRLAVWLSGGWDFVTPEAGWQAWLASEGAPVVFDGTAWRVRAAAEGLSGAALRWDIVEFDHVIGAGATSDTAVPIPAQSVVLGITCRVTGAITGTLGSWRLGVAGSDDRYGSGLGLSLNAWGRGLTGTPVTYYGDTALRLTAEGGVFAGGSVRFAVHRAVLDLPEAV